MSGCEKAAAALVCCGLFTAHLSSQKAAQFCSLLCKIKGITGWVNFPRATLETVSVKNKTDSLGKLGPSEWDDLFYYEINNWFVWPCVYAYEKCMQCTELKSNCYKNFGITKCSQGGDTHILRYI